MVVAFINPQCEWSSAHLYGPSQFLNWNEKHEDTIMFNRFLTTRSILLLSELPFLYGQIKEWNENKTLLAE